MMNQILFIGEITGKHGIKGEVKVKPLTDDPKRFSFFQTGYLVDRSCKSRTSIVCLGAKVFKNTVILKLEGIDTPEQALLLKGKFLAVTRENAIPLPENTYFICDLVGMNVMDFQGNFLGVLIEVLTTAANDVYVVEHPGQRNLLIPTIQGVVRRVDLSTREITVELPEGLLEVYGRVTGGKST